MEPTAWFVVLFVTGLLLVGAEVFVPGGLLGSLGAALVLAAIVTAYFISPVWGLTATAAAAVLSVVSIVLWIRLFPRTGLGKIMTLSRDGHDFKADQEGLANLLHREGITSSDLRPGGFATIDGRRIDVISEGGMISRGTPVVVTATEGNRVVVRVAPEKAPEPGHRT